MTESGHLVFDEDSLESEVVRLCRRLVQFETVNPPGNELACARFVSSYLEASGFSTEVFVHTASRGSVVARLHGSGGLPGLLLCGHLDVVPTGDAQWPHDPFGGVVEDGAVWGRGAADMKGGDAAILLSARVVAETGRQLRGDLVLAFTAGEEGEQLGASLIAERLEGEPLHAIIIPEPTSNQVCIAEKGTLWLEITTNGRAAHGSTPEQGHNAIVMMMGVLDGLARLETLWRGEDPLLGPPTCNIAMISGGTKPNMVPDRCVATVDLRTLPGKRHDVIVADIGRWLEGTGVVPDGYGASVRVINDRAAVSGAVDHPAVRRFCGVVATVTGVSAAPAGVPYCTDGAVLAPGLNAPLIIYGPGSLEQAHRIDEHVEIGKMVEACEVLSAAALEFLV
jgi:succinyl-diaminopimelate desuccinylase